MKPEDYLEGELKTSHDIPTITAAQYANVIVSKKMSRWVRDPVQLRAFRMHPVDEVIIKTAIVSGTAMVRGPW